MATPAERIWIFRGEREYSGKGVGWGEMEKEENGRKTSKGKRKNAREREWGG